MPLGGISADFGYSVACAIWVMFKSYLLCAAPGIAAYVIRRRALTLPAWAFVLFLGPNAVLSIGVPSSPVELFGSLVRGPSRLGTR